MRACGNSHDIVEPTRHSDGRIASTRVDPWESHTATTTKRVATEMLTRSANRKATVTVLNGTVVNIFAARDVDFSSVMK